MDYHLSNGFEDYEKPVFFWTKGDILAYVAFLDMYIEAVKSDYQDIVNYQNTNNIQIISDDDKAQIANSITSWAHDREIILQDSEDLAFPFKSHIELAILNEDRISNIIGLINTSMDSIGYQSKSQEIKDQQQESSSGIFNELSDVVKWGVIGFGIWAIYKILSGYRR